MTARRLRAPANDGGLLIDPPWSEAGDLDRVQCRPALELGLRRAGPPADRLRVEARREVTRLAREFLRRHGLSDPTAGGDGRADHDPPLIVTGHQPELFHPGRLGEELRRRCDRPLDAAAWP